MDALQIETEAISKVKTRVNLTKYLSSFLFENDKTPTWDGDIFIYGNEKKAKKDLIGRLPAQVKGHETNDFSKDEIPFAFDVADLRNFHNNIGGILFVVYLSPNKEQTDFDYKIYFIELTPTRISAILADCVADQQSVTLHLKTLTVTGDDFASLVLNCFCNCKREASFSGIELPTIKELEEQGNIQSIQFFVSGYGEEYKSFRGFLKQNTPLYVLLKGSAIPQPVKYEGEIVYKVITRTVFGTVSSGGTVFFSEYKVAETQKESIIQIGHGFSLTVKNDALTCQANYKAPHMLRQFVEDTPFLLAFFESKKCEINGAPFDFSGNGFESTNINAEKHRNKYIAFSRYADMMDKQGCKDDIDYTKLNDEDWRNLERLAQATLEGKPVYGLQSDLPPVVSMNVGPLRFAVGLTPVENEKGVYQLCHFQECKDIVLCSPDLKEVIPAPISAVLGVEDFISISNIKYDRILPSIKEFPVNDNTCIISNDIMLRLIIAADKSDEKRNTLLSTAMEIADWLIAVPDGIWDSKTAIINRLQIIKRRRQYTEEERGILLELIVSSPDRKDIMFAANALLDQKELARRYFESLSQKQKDEIKQYPIYRYIAE